MAYGDLATVTVTASNEFGESAESTSGGAAIIMTYPDAPANFNHDDTITTDT